MTEIHLTETQYTALIEAFIATAPLTLGITTDQARTQANIAREEVQTMLAEDGDGQSGVEEEAWAFLMLEVTEDYSDWDADLISTKCAEIANIPRP